MPNQEVEVTLTLNACTTKSSNEIKLFVQDVIAEYNSKSSSRNRWEFPLLEIKSIKEESELYETEKEAAKPEKTKFPNGIASYLETHFEIISFIVPRWRDADLLPECEIKNAQDSQGTGGLYELAEKWTDEFEEKYKDHDWEAGMDFWETIKAFCEEKNNEQLFK